MSRRALCPYFAVFASPMFHAFRAVVMFGIEHVCGTGFAFCVIFIGLGDEYLARGALYDCHENNARRNQKNGKGRKVFAAVVQNHKR